MRKHCNAMARRWGRGTGKDMDRSNFPQKMGHELANQKSFQLAANSLLRSLLAELGIRRVLVQPA